MRVLLLMLLLCAGAGTAASAQQIICQRPFGGVTNNSPNFGFLGNVAAVSPDSAIVLVDAAPNGHLTGQPRRLGLVWVQRGQCDTTFLRTLGRGVQGPAFNGFGPTYTLTTRRREPRVLTVKTLTSTADSNRLYLYAFTRKGQFKWQRNFSSHVRTEQAHGILEAPDRGFYLSTERAPVTSLNPVSGLLVKTDSLGQEKWRRAYCRGSGRDFVFARPCYTVRGNLLLVGTVYHLGAPAEIYGQVVEVNQRGDSVTSRPLLRGRLSTQALIQEVRPLRDGGFLLSTRLDSTEISRISTHVAFTRLDANLNEVWTRIYNPASTQQDVQGEGTIHELADGTLLCVATLRSLATSVSETRLLRLSATGQTMQVYTLPVTNLMARSTTPLAADSSFLMQGLSSTATLLQFRLAGLRRVLPAPTIPAAQVLATRAATAAWPAPAYPNPASTRLIVPLPTLSAEARLTLTDLLGRRVRALAVAPGTGAAVLEVGGLAPGVYLLTLEQAGQVPAVQRLTVAGP